MHGVHGGNISESVQGTDGEEPTQALVAIDSLGGRNMQFFLHKRPGFEKEDVLEGDLDDREGEHATHPEPGYSTCTICEAARIILCAVMEWSFQHSQQQGICSPLGPACVCCACLEGAFASHRPVKGCQASASAPSSCACTNGSLLLPPPVSTLTEAVMWSAMRSRLGMISHLSAHDASIQ